MNRRHFIKMDECLQFLLGHSSIDSFNIGIEQAEQLADLQKRIPDAVLGDDLSNKSLLACE